MPHEMRNTPEGLTAQAAALTAVREAGQMRQDVDRDYMQALRNAVDAGCTIEQIAMAAGVSRQTVYHWLRKGA